MLLTLVVLMVLVLLAVTHVLVLLVLCAGAGRRCFDCGGTDCSGVGAVPLRQTCGLEIRHEQGSRGVGTLLLG